MNVTHRKSAVTFTGAKNFRISPVANQFTVVLALIVVLNVMFFSWNESKRNPGVDFNVYWSVTHAVSQSGITDIYSPEGSAEVTKEIAARLDDPDMSERQTAANQLVLGYEKNSVDIVATPFLFSVLSLWGHDNYDRDLNFFAFSCLLLFAVSIFLISRSFGLGAITAAFFFTLFCVGFGPYMSDVRVGNINQLQLFSIALVLWLIRKQDLYRTVGAGVILGLSIMFRPSVALIALLLAVVWLLNKHFVKAARFFAGTAAGVVLAVLISAAYFGTFSCWTRWFEAAPGLLQSKNERGKGGLDYGNYGLVADLQSFLSIDLSKLILVLLIGAFGFAIWMGRGRPSLKIDDADDPMYLETAAAICLSLAFVLLSSTLVWYHYMILIIPGIMLAAALTFGSHGAVSSTPMRAIAIFGLLCLTEFPLLALSLPAQWWVLMLNVGIIATSAVLLYALAQKPTSQPPASHGVPAQARSTG